MESLMKREHRKYLILSVLFKVTDSVLGKIKLLTPPLTLTILLHNTRISVD